MEDMSQINPLHMDMILKTVLEYTGRDLLNCRLVNHRWNKMSAEILKVRGCRITINAKNVYKYQVLLLRSQLQDPNRRLVGLDLHIDLNLGDSDHIDNLNGALAILAERPVFATSLKLATRLDDANFWRLLRVAAPQLQKLHILGNSNMIEFDSRPFPEAFDFRFPQLLSINYLSRYVDEVPPVTLVKILHAAPKLRKLSIFKQIVVNTYDETRTLGILNGITANLFSLTKLEIPIVSESIIQALVNLQCVNLEKLKVHQIFSHTTGKSFAQFLTTNCPSLYSISVYYQNHNRVETADYFQAHLPQLPQITHFGYFVGELRLDFKPIATHLAIAAKQFPYLRTVSTDLQACKILAERFLVSGNVFPVHHSAPIEFRNIEFPGVVSLNVLARPGMIESMSQRVLNTISSLHRLLYPNLNEVVIQILYVAGKSFSPHNVVAALLNHDGVKRADISSYPQDWLFTIGMHQQHVFPVQGLDRLEQLRLRNPPKVIINIFNLDKEVTRNDTPSLDLPSLMNMFPHLSLLHLEVEMLNDGKLASKQLQDKMDAFKIQFPTLQILLN